MLDVKYIAANADLVKRAAENKNEAKADVDAVVRIYDEKKALLREVEDYRAQVNRISKEISAKFKEGDTEAAENLKADSKAIKERSAEAEEKIKEVGARLGELLDWIPNVPHPDVPVGADEAANKLVKTGGETREFDFEPKPHWELTANLGMVDWDFGGRVSGAGFIVFTGPGARLKRALEQFMLDLHTKEHGYTEIFPPFICNRDAFYGSGQIPKLEDDMYSLDGGDMFLIPTAEVPMTAFHRGQVLSCEELPQRYVGYSSCFRREAGAGGKDTRGMIRVHQFEKVELMKYTTPETGYEELDKLAADAEVVLSRLALPYRMQILSTGDLSFAAAKCYDFEAYAPGIGTWLEVSSCSAFEQFQARRANMRYRDADGKMQFLCTMNGSGVAVPRTLIAIIENYQNADGSVTVPEVLRPYMDGLEAITAS